MCVFLSKTELKSFEKYLIKIGRVIIPTKGKYESLRWRYASTNNQCVLYWNSKDNNLKPDKGAVSDVKNFLFKNEKIIDQKKKIVIYDPEKISSFEIQSVLYEKLKSKNIYVRGDITLEESRLDLVVFYKGRAICIIIVRSWCKNRDDLVEYHKYNYRKFNLPVLVCGMLGHINNIIEQVEKIIDINKNLNGEVR